MSTRSKNLKPTTASAVSRVLRTRLGLKRPDGTSEEGATALKGDRGTVVVTVTIVGTSTRTAIVRDIRHALDETYDIGTVTDDPASNTTRIALRGRK